MPLYRRKIIKNRRPWAKRQIIVIILGTQHVRSKRGEVSFENRMSIRHIPGCHSFRWGRYSVCTACPLSLEHHFLISSWCPCSQFLQTATHRHMPTYSDACVPRNSAASRQRRRFDPANILHAYWRGSMPAALKAWSLDVVRPEISLFKYVSGCDSRNGFAWKRNW